MAAILSQVQNGVERTIAYASRQMNRAEQSCSASEIEMLALVWATKYFRCILYGKQFLFRTDHADLSYLRNFGDSSSQLMQWSLSLSEFDFVIEHKAGTKISNVDALSRHVGAIMEDGLLDKERFLEEQKKNLSVVRENKESTPATTNIFWTKVESYISVEPIVNTNCLYPTL